MAGVEQIKNEISDSVRTITFNCVADGAGAIPNTTTHTSSHDFIKGWFLYDVTAFPKPGGTAPDEANVEIKDQNGLYLLGSIDDGVTEYAGLKLIHATGTRSCIPDKYNLGNTSHDSFFPIITGPITLIVSDQGAAGAEYTIVLTFIK